MKKSFIILLLCAGLQTGLCQLPPAIQVNSKLSISFNRNVEFLGFAYFIGYEGTNSETKMVEIGGKQLLEKDWQNYGFHFYQQYKSYASSDHMAIALSIAERLWLSDIIPLLLQVDDFPNATLTSAIGEQYYSAFSPEKNSTAAKELASRFLDACNALYRETNFDQYLAKSAAWYRAAINQVKNNLPSAAFISFMESLYRKNMDSYLLIPSLTLPKGMGFGPRYSLNGITRIYNVFGAYDFQSFLHTKQPNMGFGDKAKLRELSIHEFGHSFVNPVLNQLPDSLIKSTDSLFIPLKASMEAQGYNTWKTCFTEHLVRAGEVVIAAKMGNSESAKRLKEDYIKTRKFIYLPLIIEELQAYDGKAEDEYVNMVRRVLKKMAGVSTR